MRLKDKAILIIGGATGIGAATAKRLASEGARLCIADIALAQAENLAEHLDGDIHTTFIDLAEENSVKKAVANAADYLGHIDGVYINAADLRVIFEDSNAADVDLAVFDRTLDVNLKGHLHCTRAVLPHLLENGGGTIVYTSSEASVIGEPERPSYAMSKAGVNALMRHVASRWGRQAIRANCVAPGFVMTPEMIESGQVDPEWIAHCLAQTRSTRVGAASDVAGVVAMLLSDDGGWINGQIIHVNGGSNFR